jgi:hypothetical protein
VIEDVEERMRESIEGVSAKLGKCPAWTWKEGEMGSAKDRMDAADGACVGVGPEARVGGL